MKKYMVERVKGVNELKFYIKKKNLFGKTKLEEITEYNFFTHYKCFEDALPEFKNIKLVDFLYFKYIWSINHNTGDFKKRVYAQFIDYEDKIEEILVDGHKFYKGDCKFSFYLTDGEKIITNTMYLQLSFIDVFEPSKEFFKSIINSAFSGVYNSLRDEDNFLSIMYPDKDKWICKTCSESFATLDEFYAHLIDSHHETNLWDYFLDDKELQDVKSTCFKQFLSMIGEVHKMINNDK